MCMQKRAYFPWGEFVFLTLLLLFLAPSQGHAATFTVNSTVDVTSAATIANCQTGVGQCTLRAAIQAANASIGVADTINLPANTYIVGTGLLSVAGPAANQLTITGVGAATTIIDGNNANTVFQTTGGAVLTISGVTIQHGHSALANVGGGIDIAGGTSVALNHVIVTANTQAAVGGDGGGINNGGTLNMTDVAVTNNVNPGGGAGISIGAAGTLDYRIGTISGSNGRGIDNKGTITLTNVTISGNNAASGAGINMALAGAVAHLFNVTINGNTAGVNIGGIDNAVGGTVTIQNSIVSKNTATNCGGVMTSQGNNIDDGNSCGLAGVGDIINKDPLLAALADNGGAVQTHALLIGSPAIDSGATGTAVCPPTDARGIARPVDGDPLVNALAKCDIGAFEFRPQKITVVPVAAFDFGSVTVATTAGHVFTLTNAGDGDLILGAIAATDPLVAPFSILASATTCTTGSKLLLIPVPSANSCVITTEFAPTAVGPAADTFDVPSNDPITPTVSLALSGTGAAGPVPNISVTDSIAPNNDQKLLFGSVVIGQTSDATVTLTNTGTATLAIGTIAPPAAPFSITGDSCSGASISPTVTCSLTVRFAPTVNTQASGSFDIPVSNVPGTTSITVSLTGSGISATGNNPPSIPVLVSPTNGQTGVPTTMTFVWNKSVDPDGDAVTYRFSNCTDSTFAAADCAPTTVASAPGIWLAGIGSFGAGIILVGFVAKNGTRRARMMMLVIALLVVSGTFFVACHKSSSEAPPPAPAEQISNIVRNLTPNTTYYWKVVADDGKGGTSTSAVSSYTTGQ